jgi:hypothetical protein
MAIMEITEQQYDYALGVLQFAEFRAFKDSDLPLPK